MKSLSSLLKYPRCITQTELHTGDIVNLKFGNHVTCYTVMYQTINSVILLGRISNDFSYAPHAFPYEYTLLNSIAVTKETIAAAEEWVKTMLFVI